MRSSSDLRNYLVDRDVPHEIVQLPGHTRTAQRAAELLGVALRDVVKSLVFLADGEPVLVLVSGDAKVDASRLGTTLRVAEIELARAPQVLELTGYRRGAVPPVALERELPVLADPAVFVPTVVYCGGGSTTTMLKIRSDDLRSLAAPRLVTLTAGS